ncbi:MAG: hypothetical protein LBV67_01255 [Streptococcaceae bacterium]|nr:hypothetical protein [Streptococcaceae bacterium]
MFNTITSKYESKSEFIKLQYYPIVDWKDVGFDKPSYIDIKSFKKFSKEIVEKYFSKEPFGTLSKADQIGLEEFVASYLARRKSYHEEQKHAKKNGAIDHPDSLQQADETHD